MTSQKLNPSDRKQANASITGHFDSLLQCDVAAEVIAKKELVRVRKQFKSEADKCVAAEKKAREMRKALEKKLPSGFEVEENGRIKIEWRGEYTVANSFIKETEKKNKPIVQKKKRALAKLQTTETREELAKLYKSLGIL